MKIINWLLMGILKTRAAIAATQAPTPKKNKTKPGAANSSRNKTNPSANQIIEGCENCSIGMIYISNILLKSAFPNMRNTKLTRRNLGD
jgi:hypothetical protein